MTISAPVHEIRLCAWRGEEVHTRNGRTQPGDPDPCAAEMHWADAYTRWQHVDIRLDADHKPVFGRVDDREDDERGESLRQRYGIDGTAGDAQGVDHPFHAARGPESWCVVCGLSEAYRRHRAEARR